MDLRYEPPTVEQYVRLRAVSGLTPRTPEQAAPTLVNSWAWATVHVDGEVVAMGRVIGDGGWYFHLADMATLPEHQRRGYGRAILQALLERIHSEAPGQPWVTLFADPPGVPLYRAMGFVDSGCRGMELAVTSGPPGS